MRLTHYDKLILYRNNCYATDPPPIVHLQWTEANWVQWIDIHGVWYGLDALDELKAEDQKRNPSREFLAASVSVNQNAFGLRDVILVSPSGEAWEVGCSSPPKTGETLIVPLAGEPLQLCWYQTGWPFEIPRRLPDAPLPVLKELFPSVKTKNGRTMRSKV